MEPRERAFAHELTYGTTRLRGRLDHLLARHVHRGLPQLDPGVLEILRLGAYQLLYMGGVPSYAAVSQSVDQASERGGSGPGGLVNAVLRKVGEAGESLELFPDFAREPAGFLATWGSHPRWLIDRWLRHWDPGAVRWLVAANNRRPSVYLVPLDVEPAEAVGLLAAADLEAEPVEQGTRCVRLAPGVKPAAAFLALPHAIAQDPAANLVAAYADVSSGTKVADLCAAPGGKAIAISDRPLYTLAVDRSEARLRMVRDNAARTERKIGLAVADARRPPLRDVDVVLLDAPCAGTGTFARRPDARWRLTERSIGDLVALQEEMLTAAAGVVAKGGLLVYSTCSLEPEENKAQVESFLEAHEDFHIEATSAVPARYVDAAGCLVVTPQDSGFDGAFAARLRRAT
jgi:16S rRNA (cytosine967-C5)-methyltransferase